MLMLGFSGLHMTAIIAVLVVGVWYLRRQYGIAVAALSKQQLQTIEDIENYLHREC